MSLNALCGAFVVMSVIEFVYNFIAPGKYEKDIGRLIMSNISSRIGLLAVIVGIIKILEALQH